MTHEVGLARVDHASVSSTTVQSQAGRELRLHGAILLPKGFIPNGTVVIRGHRIDEVIPTRSPGEFELDTEGLICPGFVDTHNHAPFAIFPRWTPAQKFKGRFDWRGKTRCGFHPGPHDVDKWYSQNIATPFKTFPSELRPLMYLYGQMRGLIGGATTMLVDADYPSDALQWGSLKSFVRDYTDWPTKVYGVLDIGCLSDEVARVMELALRTGHMRLFVHLGEGSDDYARGEFFTLRLAKHLLTKNTALIHALALQADDWNAVQREGAAVVWSPRSNETLYDQHLDIKAVMQREIRVALAPDWSVTGSSTVLDELRFARARFPWIPSETLLDMVTTTAADILGFSRVGRIEKGCLADLVVFGVTPTTRSEAADGVTSAGHDRVRLVLIGGVGTYGEPAIMRASALAAQHGAPLEPLTVPLGGGQSIDRLVRFNGANDLGTPGHHPFSDVVKSLRGARSNLADLWEP